ncbi:MAG: hypothetical protein LBH51_09160 [Treponema sp.]|jgi:hypothetical protein|nr:hypothetical protein [Treponema sp.]
MKLRFLFGMLILAAALGPLGAQDREEDWTDEPGEDVPADDWSGFIQDLYSRGDQAFGMSFGVAVPTVFAAEDGGILPRNIVIGGTGSLSYDYFLGSNLFVGGEVQGMFAPTLGQHMLFIIPIHLRAGYQFVINRFEFPLSLGFGIAAQQFRTSKSYSYTGIFVKPKVSAFFRFNPDWSFGLNTAWWWIPQTMKNSSDSVQGHFFEATLAVRYHF